MVEEEKDEENEEKEDECISLLQEKKVSDEEQIIEMEMTEDVIEQPLEEDNEKLKPTDEEQIIEMEKTKDVFEQPLEQDSEKLKPTDEEQIIEMEKTEDVIEQPLEEDSEKLKPTAENETVSNHQVGQMNHTREEYVTHTYPFDVNVVIIEKKDTIPTEKERGHAGKGLILHKTNGEKISKEFAHACSSTKDNQIQDEKGRTMVEQLTELVGPTSELEDFKKYSRLSNMEPSNKMFQSKKGLAEAKIQTQMLKKHAILKEKLREFDVGFMKNNCGGLPSVEDYKQNSDIYKIYRQKQLAEKYIKYWGMDCF